MSQHSALHLQLHTPTGVTHTGSAYLTCCAPAPGTPIDAAPLPNLVVVRNTLLEVYKPVRLDSGVVKLDQIARQRLFGVVESLAVLRGKAGRSGRDAILLAFRDAKLSVLQWDPAIYDLAPSSLHYFEGDESLKGGRQAFARPPLVVTDPMGRCAAVVMLRHQLAVLPATESESAALGMVGDDPYAPGANFGGGGLIFGLGSGHTVAAAVGNAYVDNLSKMNIREIRDAVFLHGSAEPTLLVLHEGDPSWAGNLRSKKDTCALSALSLNLSAKRHPKIWGIQNVPSDVYRLIACPSGGALVLCSTCILYYAQGQQTGVVLHSAALPARQPPPPLVFDLTKEAPGEAAAKYAREHATELNPSAASSVLAFCDTSPAGWNLECDAAHGTWLSRSTALLGLKTGQLLLVEVARQGGGSVKLRVAKAGAAPVASAMAGLSPSLVFIGSVAGDSLLVGCSLSGAHHQPLAVNTSIPDGNGDRDAKRRRLESADADKAEGQPDDVMIDEEEVLLYGEVDDLSSRGGTSGAAHLRCSLKVVDSFIGIGPIRAMASSVSGASETEAPYLVACCGRDKGGALAILRRSVAPDVVTEVPLPEVRGAWAVGSSGDARYHSYLLITFPDSTKVLSTDDELKDVTDLVEFAGDTPTLAAGTVAGGRRVLQAFPQGLRLLENGEQRQEVWTREIVGDEGDPGIELSAVHISDPFVLAQLTNGTVAVLRVDPGSGEMGLLGILSGGSTGTVITSCCLYSDSCGWLYRNLFPSVDVPDESSHFCMACFSDGTSSMWCLPDVLGDPVWRCSGLGEGPLLIIGGSSGSKGKGVSNGAAVVEVRLDSFEAMSACRPDVSSSDSSAPGCSAPVLVAITADNTLLAYKAFSWGEEDEDEGNEGNIQDRIRFKRLVLDAPAVLPPAVPQPGTNTAQQAQQQRIFRFDGLGEQIPHSGLFIAGSTPIWLIAARGTLFAHPLHMSPGMSTVGFTPFHNINSPHAFITVCSGSRPCIQIAGLPLRQRLDGPWPRQKVAIKATPHRVCLYPEAQLFAVAASHNVPYKPCLPEEEGGEPQASYSYALLDAVAAARGTQVQHEIRLVQPGTWATLWQYALLPGEVALAVETVHLRDATTGATVPLLAVGAGFGAGEDYPCSGRVLLFEVRRNSTSGQSPSWSAEMIFAREFKGPVTGLATMEGHLLLSTGHRLETCTLSTVSQAIEGGEGADSIKTIYKMQRSAFYDGPSLVTSLCVVKSFALVGDASHSVQFVRYREEGRQLALLGKDFGRAAVHAAQFLIAGSSLHIAMADSSRSLRMFTYSPGDSGSWKGQKLVPWGVLHIGEGVGAMTRLRMPQPDSIDTTARHAVVYGSDAGAIGAVMPIAVGEHLMQPKGPDGTPKGTLVSALKALQKELAGGMAHGAGLNPAAFRRRHAKIPPALEGSRPYGAPLGHAAQGLLDGDLLIRYAGLPRAVQARMATKAGVKREEVLEVLAAMFKTSCLL